MGALLRFLQAANLTKHTYDGDDDHHLHKMLTQLRKRVPKTIEQWLAILISLADNYPLCCVVSDMSAAGAPMVYVNTEFCRITGYEHSEACGRNCRFLQGPKTECQAVSLLHLIAFSTQNSRLTSYVRRWQNKKGRTSVSVSV